MKQTKTVSNQPACAVLKAEGHVLSHGLALGYRDDFVVLSALRKDFSLSAQDAARLGGVSVRSWAALEAVDNKRVLNAEAQTPHGSPSMMRKLAEMQALLHGLGALMPALSVGAWLQQPNEYFQGLSPLEIVERGQMHRLWELIHHASAGEPV